MNLWQSQITATAVDEIKVRGVPIDDLICGYSFPKTLHLMFTGQIADEYTERIYGAILTAFCDHGLNPPSTNATRFAASCGVQMTSAVVAGLSCIGEFHAPIESCAAMLRRAVTEKLSEDDIVRQYRDSRRRVPGFGHPIHETDPRVDALVSLAQDGLHLQLAKNIAFCLQEALHRNIPLNAAGASAAILCDCGMPTEFMNAFFIIGRTVGLVAHAVEQAHDKKKVKVT